MPGSIHAKNLPPCAVPAVPVTRATADSGPADAAAVRLVESLARAPASHWLDLAREHALRGDWRIAETVLRAALARFADDGEVHVALASVLWQAGDADAARVLLRDWLQRQPAHLSAAFTLARLEGERLDFTAAASALRAAFRHPGQPADLALRGAKMLADWGDKPAAVEICEAAIAAGSDDPKLHLYAAALLGQVGDFARARQRYEFALDHDPSAIAAGAAYGLATMQRYVERDNADRQRFEQALLRADLGDAARASVLFALGKLHDDLGEFAAAAHCLRQANALVDHGNWSRRNWRRLIDARLSAKPLPARTPLADECVPIFVVGAPRSGTTLVAELLGRAPQVVNRGELDWLPHLAERVAAAPRVDVALLDEIAATYLQKLQQGERDARCFIDKQPLNFLHLDLIRALFPQAWILCSRRSERDTALSIWSQHFGSSEYRFAYDFDDIAAVLRGGDKLMAKAKRAADARVIEVRYESLAQDPQTIIDGIAATIGLPAFDCSRADEKRHAIGTASLWQARQPVYTASIGRWRAYAPFLPELLGFADD